MLISQNFEIANCATCGKQFQSYLVRGAKLRRCPTCADIKQGRPSIVVDRGIDFHQIIKIENLPGSWQVFQATRKDAPCWKISVKGDMFGVSFSGRIDIFSHDVVPPKPGDAALFESCVSVHRREDLPDRPLEIREYFRLSNAGMQAEEELPRLIWLTAEYKTTIKGLGRQYKNSLVGSPVWEHRISGQCRTGRYGGTGAMAIVDDAHPLWVREDFNY